MMNKTSFDHWADVTLVALWIRMTLCISAVFAYCSEANNPVGAEWLISLGSWNCLSFDLIDLHDQLWRYLSQVDDL